MAVLFAVVRGWDDIANYVDGYRTYFTQVVAIAQEVEDVDLIARLRMLSLPTPPQRQRDWQLFADGLRAIMREERDIGHNWRFSGAWWKQLNDYFAANKLLIDCLELAYVSDKQAILNGLLMPPV